MSANAIDCMERLDKRSMALDNASNALAQTERELEPIEGFIEEFTDDFETGLWDAHVKDDAKLPSEAMRERLCRRAMPPGTLEEHRRLIARRKRLEKTISGLKAAVEADRSILSALKVEAEASGAGLRSAA